MNSQVRWLTPEEMRLWRSFLAIEGRVHLDIQRDLKVSSGLTEPEFEVLANLSEAPGPMRMTALADAMLWERSRLSHQISRMTKRGLVERTSCPEDGRGAFVTISPAGLREITKAAPSHVDTVRQSFLDRLGPDDQRELSRLLGLIADTDSRTTHSNPADPQANRENAAPGVPSDS